MVISAHILLNPRFDITEGEEHRSGRVIPAQIPGLRGKEGADVFSRVSQSCNIRRNLKKGKTEEGGEWLNQKTGGRP